VAEETEIVIRRVRDRERGREVFLRKGTWLVDYWPFAVSSWSRGPISWFVPDLFWGDNPMHYASSEKAL